MKSRKRREEKGAISHLGMVLLQYILHIQVPVCVKRSLPVDHILLLDLERRVELMFVHFDPVIPHL